MENQALLQALRQIVHEEAQITQEKLQMQVDQLRTDMQTQIGQLRTEMNDRFEKEVKPLREDIADLRRGQSQLKCGQTKMQAMISGMKAEMHERFDKLESITEYALAGNRRFGSGVQGVIKDTV